MLSVKFNVWRLGHFFYGRARCHALPSAVLLMGRLEALPSQCRLAYGQERFTPFTASLSKGFSGQKCLG